MKSSVYWPTRQVTLAGGHQFKLREQLASMQRQWPLLPACLGIGAAMVAGAASKPERAGSGWRVVLPWALPKLAMRNLLNYQRTEEMAADRSADHLSRKHWSVCQRHADDIRTFLECLVP